MNKLQVEKTHITEAKRIFSGNELRLLLADLVAKEAKMPDPHMQGIRHGNQGVTATVRFEEETEGSPAYKVGVRAIVTITQDHGYVAEEKPAPTGESVLNRSWHYDSQGYCDNPGRGY